MRNVGLVATAGTRGNNYHISRRNRELRRKFLSICCTLVETEITNEMLWNNSRREGGELGKSIPRNRGEYHCRPLKISTIPWLEEMTWRERFHTWMRGKESHIKI